ncbi:hypothetical protein EUX98_g1041 [Antrodiella citrinella]|uniref:Methyltransferase domain-containing protein n=1 Tax=Antrodiella citrinella TaxID=2447956 RepID=A0A4S4N5E4_9APHY|nr:hypothetical protein EUX98_g1041 [Antrodiella citrinella]
MDWTSPVPASTSLGDGAFFSAASSTPSRTPTPAPVPGGPGYVRSNNRSTSSTSSESSTSSFSSGIRYNQFFSKMGLFTKDAPDNNTTPKKGQPLHDASNNARKVFSPNAMFCESPPSSEQHSLSNISLISNATVRPAYKQPKHKRSLAKLLDLTLPGSARSSEDSTPNGTPDLSSSNESDGSSGLLHTSSTVSDDEDEEETSSEDEEDYYLISRLRQRGDMLHHRFSKDVAPYMQAYSTSSLNNDYYAYDLYHRLSPTGSPSFHDYGHKPPRHVLDLGCGEGYWAAEAATTWKEAGTKVTAFDLVDLGSAVRKSIEPDVAKKMKWMKGNFVINPLPFQDNTFDMVRMANLTLAIPRSRWLGLLTEVRRVLKPLGRLELIDDEIVFPTQAPFSAPIYYELTEKWDHDDLVDNWLPGKKFNKDETARNQWLNYEQKKRRAEVMESIFENMLTKKYDIAMRPHLFLPDLLARVFGPSRTCTAGTHEIQVPVGQAGGKLPEHGMIRRSTESEVSGKLAGFFRTGRMQSKENYNPESGVSSFPGPSHMPFDDAVLKSTSKMRRMLVDDSAVESKAIIPRYQPAGLLLSPSSFAPMGLDTLEMHVLSNVHVLLACKHAMQLYVEELNEVHGSILIDEKEFDDMFWQYDYLKRERMNWPRPRGEVRVDSDLTLTQRLFRGCKKLIMDTPEPAPIEPDQVSPPVEGVKPPICNYLPVRTIRVFSAIKA